MEESVGQPVDQQPLQQQQQQQQQQHIHQHHHHQQQQQLQSQELQSHLETTAQVNMQPPSPSSHLTNHTQPMQNLSNQQQSQPPQQQPNEQFMVGLDAEDLPQRPNLQQPTTPSSLLPPPQQPPASQMAQPADTLTSNISNNNNNKRDPIDTDHPQQQTTASSEMLTSAQEGAATNQQQQPSATNSNNARRSSSDQRIVKLIGGGSGGASATATVSSPAPTRNLTEDLFSTKKWGITPIRQDTPWELPPSPTQTTGPQPPIAGSTVAPTLPPGISQSSGDSFRSPAAASHLGDFHSAAAAAATLSNQTSSNQFGLNGLASNLSQMNLGNSTAAVAAAAGLQPSSRIDQSWRPPMSAIKQHPQALAAAAAAAVAAASASSSPFANHNLMNSAQSIQKSLLNSGAPGQNPAASAFLAIHQQNNEFARAPGPASSNTNSSSTSSLDNSLNPKPYGMANASSSTWSAFGTSTASSDPNSDWPRSSACHTGPNSTQPSNAFDLVPEFESGKSWPRSVFMNGLNTDDDSSSMSSASNVPGMPSLYGGSVGGSSKSPTGNQYEQSGIGTWSPVVVKGNRPNSKWDGDGPESGRGENGRFDDGTAIWGSTGSTSSKVSGGIEWGEKNGDVNSINDNARSMAANNQQQQSYRPQHSSSSTSLLVSSNTSLSSQHDQQHQQQRNQQTLKQPSLNFDQVQQLNALSSQANQPNRGIGLSCNVPSTQQLKHMVQQIQLAVQAGHLNSQILDQPLAPVTLQLLCQLLQNIRTLQQLQMQASQQFNKQGNHPSAVNVHITRTKQNILNLQNQIAAQQAIYLKQTQGHNISMRQQPTMPVMATGGHTSNLSQMNLGSAGATGLHPSSRIDQSWRPPMGAIKQNSQAVAAAAAGSPSPFANHNLMNSAQSIQKSLLNSGAPGQNPAASAFLAIHQQNNEFARAPGPASSNTNSSSTSSLDNSLNPKPYGMANASSSTWSAFGTSTASSDPNSDWPRSSACHTGPNSTQPSNAFDLVPEFEPGKPWRGSMLMKSVEDDPTMTPGSMTRSLAPQRKTIWSDEML